MSKVVITDTGEEVRDGNVLSETMIGICQNCGDNALLYMWHDLLVCYSCRDRG